MSARPPSPLVAALGLVATAADGVRALPRVVGSVHQRYEELAVRGRDVLAGRTPADEPPADKTPADEPTARPPAPAQPSGAAIAAQTAPGAAAAPPLGRSEPVVLPADVQDEVAQLIPGADLRHDELPLPDFDHQTVPQLRGRLRTLGLAELVQLRDYEQAHAARLPVLTLLDNRIAKLLADTGQ
jgi:hypothetical protein